jgi:hypothetical protein
MGVVEDGERQGNQAEPGAQLVDGVRSEDPAQPGELERGWHQAER